MLKIGDKVQVTKSLVAKVCKAPMIETYYLSSSKLGFNRDVTREFELQDGDHRSLMMETVGYYDGGDFPNCRSLEDLTKVVDEMFRRRDSEDVEDDDRFCLLDI